MHCDISHSVSRNSDLGGLHRLHFDTKIGRVHRVTIPQFLGRENLSGILENGKRCYELQDLLDEELSHS